MEDQRWHGRAGAALCDVGFEHHPSWLAVMVLTPESVLIPRLAKRWSQTRSVSVHPERTAMPAVGAVLDKMQEAGVVLRIVVIVHGE